MKLTTPGSKANLRPRQALQAGPAAGESVAALEPPRYGIDFIDRASAVEPAVAAAAVQRQPGPEEDEEVLQGRFDNRTGMPDALKAGVESLSGMDLSDVRVHANSPKPAQLNAVAYTQGNDIHVAPGQEQHLAHEAWHVVQQREGRVKPTMELKGTQINDDAGLEKEADVMGSRAAEGA